MGNPVACSAALKSIEIFERENYMEKIKHIEDMVRNLVSGFTHPAYQRNQIYGWLSLFPGT